MRHMLHQFGPCLKWPWTKLEAPELTDELIDRMVEGTAEQAAGRSIRELEQLRDGYLVAVQQALKQFNIGAGATLNALESRLFNAAAAKAPPAATGDGPRRLYETHIRPEWIDYNGHLTDFRYQHILGDAVDVLFREIGVDDAYRAAGHAPYTAEMQIRYLAEVKQTDSVYVTVQVLDCDAKRFWLYLRMHRVGDDKLVAVGEHLYIHVDAKAGKSAPMPAPMAGKLAAMRDAHAKLPRPADAGRGMSLAKR
jgi:carnitine 3-dehydrogenase